MQLRSFHVSSIDIRRAAPGDADALLDLWCRAASTPSVTDTAEDLDRVLQLDHARVFVATDGDGLFVGSVIATFDGWRGNVYRMAVAPGHRRQGLGLRLVSEADEWLRAAGAKRVTALVEGDNEVAQAFWSAAGFGVYEGMRRYVKTV
jgi:ribosomal protein S18 acetylase RimI-like enzyme